MALDSSLAALQAGIGGVLAGNPAAAIAAAAVTTIGGDIVKRLLSPREEQRVETLVSLAAAQIALRRAEGAEPRTDLDPTELTELLEGALLAAKDSYEQKKLPLLANLIAAAPFTGTPLANLVGSLYLAESLTYRQLCILAVLKPFEPWNGPALTGTNVAHLMAQQPLAESHEGVIQDLQYLVALDLVVHAPRGQLQIVPSADLVPADAMLTYRARLLYNGMRLRTIPQEDLADVLGVLGAGPPNVAERHGVRGPIRR